MRTIFSAVICIAVANAIDLKQVGQVCTIDADGDISCGVEWNGPNIWSKEAADYSVDTTYYDKLNQRPAQEPAVAPVAEPVVEEETCPLEVADDTPMFPNYHDDAYKVEMDDDDEEVIVPVSPVADDDDEDHEDDYYESNEIDVDDEVVAPRSRGKGKKKGLGKTKKDRTF